MASRGEPHARKTWTGRDLPDFVPGNALTEERIILLTSRDIFVTVDSVARYYGGAGYRPDPNTRQRIQNMIALSSSAIAPTAFYRLFRLIGSTKDGVIMEGGAKLAVPAAELDHSAEFLVAGIFTLQAVFDVFYQQAARSGDLCRAMMADAIGVAYLESLSLYCLSLFRKEAKMMGLFAGCFFGPGYGDYPLEGQKQLFDLINAAAVGVRLLSSMAMEPLKSLSFFLFYGREEKERSRLSKCGRCHLFNCRFRRASAPQSHI